MRYLLACLLMICSSAFAQHVHNNPPPRPHVERHEHDRYGRHDYHECHEGFHGHHVGFIIQYSWPVGYVDLNDRIVDRCNGWVPGHYESCPVSVLVEAGHYEDVWCDPVYHWFEGKKIKDSDGCFVKTWIPDRYEVRYRDVWISGYYVQR